MTVGVNRHSENENRRIKRLKIVLFACLYISIPAGSKLALMELESMGTTHHQSSFIKPHRHPPPLGPMASIYRPATFLASFLQQQVSIVVS